MVNGLYLYSAFLPGKMTCVCGKSSEYEWARREEEKYPPSTTTRAQLPHAVQCDQGVRWVVRLPVYLIKQRLGYLAGLHFKLSIACIQTQVYVSHNIHSTCFCNYVNMFLLVCVAMVL